MRMRITVKAIIFKDGKVLLVKHVHPKKGFEWWAFPGGGMKGKETIFETVEREVWEETGLKVRAGEVRFLRQYIDEEDGANNLELFVTSSIIKGKETIENIKGKGEDENYIKKLDYFSEEKLKEIKVLPNSLKSKLFNKESDDKKIEFIGVEYIDHR